MQTRLSANHKARTILDILLISISAPDGFTKKGH